MGLLNFSHVFWLNYSFLWMPSAGMEPGFFSYYTGGTIVVPVLRCLLSGLISLSTPAFCEEGWGKTREEEIKQKMEEVFLNTLYVGCCYYRGHIIT